MGCDVLPPTFVPDFHDEKCVKRMSYGQLGNTDMVVSKVGLGGCPFGNLYGEVDLSSAQEVTRQAMLLGVNFIDTAPFYGAGRSEEFFGKVLKDIPRQAYYLATKVGRYGSHLPTMFDYSAKRVLEEFDNSLKRLNAEYVDLIQIHDVEFARGDEQLVREALSALQLLKDAGKARYIGITGYPLSVLKYVVFSNSVRSIIDKTNITIDTVITYSRATLLDNTLEDYVGYFKSKNVGIINASPTSLGLLTPQGPQPWHSANAEIKEKARKAVEYCKEMGVDIARLAHFFAFNFKGVQTTLIGVNNVEMLKSNIDTACGQLSPTEQECLRTVRQRFFDKCRNHWEGVELERLAKEIESMKSQDTK